MSARQRRVATAVVIGAAAIAVLWRTVGFVRTRRSKRFDADLRRRFRSFHTDGRDAASRVVTAASAPAVMVPLNCLTAFLLRRRGSAVWLPIALAPFAAMTAGAIFSRTMPRQFAPGGESTEQCFPSGHTTGLTAEAATIAYVLRRERVVGPSGAALLVAGAAIGGVNRLYRDRHWATDIIAGWSAGLAVASVCALLSELIPM